MKIFLLVLISSILLLASCSSRMSEPGNDLSVRCLELAKNISTVSSEQGISIDNSDVRIETPEISKVIRRGISEIPFLVRVMKSRVSFDTFTRCASASSEILKKYDDGFSIGWYGGASTVKSADGTTRVHIGGQMDSDHFRKVIADNIIKKYNKIIEDIDLSNKSST